MEKKPAISFCNVSSISNAGGVLVKSNLRIFRSIEKHPDEAMVSVNLFHFIQIVRNFWPCLEICY